ncbi:hypothetical protein POBR111598_09935 [Polynucleobacter brandtiae]
MKVPPIFAVPELLKLSTPAFLKLALELTVKLLVLAELLVLKANRTQILSMPFGSDAQIQLAFELLMTAPHGPVLYGPTIVAFAHALSLKPILFQFVFAVGSVDVTFQFTLLPAYVPLL